MISAKWKAVAMLVGVFLLGAVAGVGGTLAHQARGHIEARRFDFERRGELSLQALTRRLDLSEAQRGKVAQLLEGHAPARRKAMQEVMERCGSSFKEEKAKLDGEIRALLTPEQQKRFDEISARQHERMFAPFGQPGRGRGTFGRGRRADD